MAKRLKRAFTIVELVIVIAVIAILAAVLIPTFTTLIDKANESNDIALVKNLNTALVSKEATDEVNTMQDALDAAYEYGYTVDKLTPSSSGDIVWDEVNNRFALINDGKVVFGDGNVSEGASLWRIAKDTKDFSATYSNYLAGKWTEVPEASTGVDVGTNEGLDVTYTNTDAKQTVTIRTNGGTLTVNGPEDTVNHYDTAVKVKITAVGKNSYHEYGEVLGNIELTSGRVVVENNATVSTILVKTQSKESFKVEVSSNATVGTVAATTAGVITSENTTVPSTTDKVTEAITTSEDFAGGIGTKKSPYLISSTQEFLNIATVALDGAYFQLISDIDMIDVVNENYTTTAVTDYFAGHIDGTGHVLKLGKSEKGGNDDTRYLFLKNKGDITFKNLIIEQAQFLGGIIEDINIDVQTGNALFENITVRNIEGISGSNTETYFATFCCHIHSAGNKSVIFRNCNNEAVINSTGYVGFIVANYISNATGNGVRVVFESCGNYGTLTGVVIGFFTGNPANMDKIVLSQKADFSDVEAASLAVYVANCGNYGVMKGVSAVGAFSACATSSSKNTNIETINQQLINTERFSISSGVISEGAEEVSLVLENNKVVYKQTISEQSSYEIICQTSISFGNGSGYVQLEQSTESVYITKFISDVQYSAKYSVEYQDIEAEEQTDSIGWKYKMVALNDGSYMVVVNTQDIPAAFSWAVGVTLNESEATYVLNVYNSDGRIIASTMEKASSLKK